MKTNTSKKTPKLQTHSSNTRHIRVHAHPPGLRVELACDDEWANVRNTLLVDDAGNFYLANTQGGRRDDPTVMLGGRFNAPGMLVSQARYCDVDRITLVEALGWYVKIQDWYTSSTGNVATLCQVAADHIKSLYRVPMPSGRKA